MSVQKFKRIPLKLYHDSIAISFLNHKALEDLHVDALRHRMSIEEKIAQILSGEDVMCGLSEASFLGDAPGPSDG
jgi:hypothetical protein